MLVRNGVNRLGFIVIGWCVMVLCICVVSVFVFGRFVWWVCCVVLFGR